MSPPHSQIEMQYMSAVVAALPRIVAALETIASALEEGTPNEKEQHT